MPRRYFEYFTSPQEREAIEALSAPERYPLLSPLGRLDLVLCQLGAFSAFAPWKTWALVHRYGGYYARRVVLDRQTSQEHGGQVVPPSLYGSEARLPFEQTRTLAGELGNLSLPLRPLVEPQGLGLDGTTHSLSVETFAGSVALSWWEDGPPGWAALAQWHARAVELFEEHLPPTSS